MAKDEWSVDVSVDIKASAETVWAIITDLDGASEVISGILKVERLGGPAAKVLLDTTTGITRLRGRWGTWQGPDGLQIPVMPTFHPAYLLRKYTPEVRGQVWSDMQAVMTRLGR